MSLRRTARTARTALRNLGLTGRPRQHPAGAEHGAGGDQPPFASACYAPTVSMYFDQFGDVRACCQNTESLMGNVTRQSIREIWQSAGTRRIRAALAEDDYSEGCGFCRWQVDQGDDAIVFARIFDEHPVSSEHPEWPVQMEFSMTNSCNLQCVMCNGDWSSSIRTHREHRPPLPIVYDEPFFEELASFLPHLRKTNFLGGEPFLGREPLRVLSMLAELDRPPDVAVTTNGTQWSPRIEQICERLPISFVLSLDGITRETYESIRVGADFDVVMANLERFQETAARHGTMVTLAHCLMRPNWHEFSRLLRFAEDRGLEVGMNEVLFPVELSLFQLPPEELREVVTTMDRDPGGVAASLDRLRPVWDGQVDALRHRLEVLDRGQVQHIRPWGGGPEQKETWEERAVRFLTEWVGDAPPTRIELDLGRAAIVGEQESFLAALGVDGSSGVEDVLQLLTAHLGDAEPRTPAGSDLIHDVLIGVDDGTHPLQFRVAWSVADGRTTALVAVRNPPPPPVLPDDPVGVLRAWCGADRVVELRCTVDDRICEVAGDPSILGAGLPRVLVGSTAAELFGLLQDRLGQVSITPGPSGHVADSWVVFGDDRTGDAHRLRIMVDRGEQATTMYIGVPSGDARD